ncbi:2-oxoacid dehydrogenase/acyltransferase catalytic subunit [Scopulibacillus darangshiensis]|uniref:2-oxoacid dehydrogenase/acyltransferase catalytic subunit n=1 Tax=Scopulibacillus darangshiensis TaxID=442528 RepID=A0A4R2NGZ2_9BACL|nr:2-oxoacid dehydrogenase/acyltransferase catalytic subunit [Scopulibacillus darangshiensis]
MALQNGLLVPVIRDANNKGLEQIANQLSCHVKAAKENRIESSKLKGGTFTITNLGMYGIDSFTPIINQPETGSLGVGRIIDRPVFIDDALEKRSFISFSLPFDHRALDGAEAAQFLQGLDDKLQQPANVHLSIG